MIPLAHWLSGEGSVIPHDGIPQSPSDDHQGSEFEHQTSDLSALVAIAREQVRDEFRQEADVWIAAARQQERKDQESQMVLVVAEWSERCAAVTESALVGLLQELQESIGRALADVLQPLLPAALRQQAISTLLDLLKQEFETAGGEILEVRAPQEMHVRLRTILDQLGIQAALVESCKIETVAKHGISRFEQLADAWARLVLKDVA